MRCVAVLLFAVACGGRGAAPAAPQPTPSAAATPGGEPSPSTSTSASDDEPSPSAATVSEADARLAVDRIAVLLDQLAADLAAAGGDCGRLAGAIDAWAGRNRGAVIAAGDALGRSAAEVQARLGADLEARTAAAGRQIELAVQRCRDDDRVTQAAARLLL
jgi:hypothetical protein